MSVDIGVGIAIASRAVLCRDRICGNEAHFKSICDSDSQTHGLGGPKKSAVLV
jgi:hypothetical protein